MLRATAVGSSQTWLFQTWLFAIFTLFCALLRPFAPFLGGTETLIFFSLPFWKNKEKPTKTARILSRGRTPKSLEKKQNRSKRQGFPWKEKSKEIQNGKEKKIREWQQFSPTIILGFLRPPSPTPWRVERGVIVQNYCHCISWDKAMTITMRLSNMLFFLCFSPTIEFQVGSPVDPLFEPPADPPFDSTSQKLFLSSFRRLWLLRSFAALRLRSFALFMRAFACFCVRRPRFETAEAESLKHLVFVGENTQRISTDGESLRWYWSTTS